MNRNQAQQFWKVMRWTDTRAKRDTHRMDCKLCQAGGTCYLGRELKRQEHEQAWVIIQMYRRLKRERVPYEEVSNSDVPWHKILETREEL